MPSKLKNALWILLLIFLHLSTLKSDCVIECEQPSAEQCTFRDVHLTTQQFMRNGDSLESCKLKKHNSSIYIDFVDSSIEVLRKGMLYSISDVFIANFSRLGLKRIEPFTFVDGEILTLDLSRNNLTELNENAIAASVQIIDLSWNQMAAVDGSFSNVKTNDEINLSHNQLSSFPIITRRNQSNTFLLKANHNRIAKIRAGDLEGLENLVWLHLSHNEIQQIDESAFRSLTELVTLDLSSNRLGYFPKIELEALKDLDLSLNRLSSKGLENVWHMSSLKTLNVSGNPIGQIEDSAFDKLWNLETLDLSETNISNLTPETFQRLSNLRNLHLISNGLQNLSIEIFLPLKSLVLLRIDDNGLHEFQFENIKQSLPNIRYLGLTENPWTCDYLRESIEILQSQNVGLYFEAGRRVLRGPNVEGVRCEDTVTVVKDACKSERDDMYMVAMIVIFVTVLLGLIYAGLRVYHLKVMLRQGKMQRIVESTEDISEENM